MHRAVSRPLFVAASCLAVLSATVPHAQTPAPPAAPPPAETTPRDLAAAPAPTSAQAPPATPAAPSWRTGVDVVSVAVTVTDAQGRLVTGLPREAFSVYEDGAEQRITQFVNERVPVSLGILLDVSESMTGPRMDDARFALGRFVNDLLSQDDEAFLMVFNHRPRVVVPWTLRPGRLAGQLDGVIPTGGTAVYDAIAEALPLYARRAHQRAALVVISDGADTASDTDTRTLRSRLRREDAFVYALAVDAPGRRPVSGRVDPYALRAITDESGGYTEVVHDTRELVPATARIAEELNSQYLIGYVPPRKADGTFHSIRVRVTDTTYKLRSRRGYVAEARGAR
jgi:Ca-activated chloride channel family protein